MGSVVFTRYSPSQYGNVYIDVRVNYSESYNSSTNQSTVTITSVEIKNRSYSPGSKVIKGRVKINGTTVASFSPGTSSSAQANISTGYTTITGGSLSSKVVSHNEDGTGSFTLTLDEGDSVSSYYTGIFGYQDTKTKSGVTTRWKVGIATPSSQTVSLTSQPRGSTIASATSSVATQGTFELVMTKALATNKHKATITCGGTTLYTSSDFFDTSMSITVPRSWFSGFTTVTSLTCTVSVQTYNSGGTAVGSPATKTLTVTADADMKPAVSAGWVSISAYNTGSAAENIVGFVKGYSKAAVTFNSTYIDLSDTEGASIASYTVTCQGESVSSSPYRTPVLTQNSLVCTVTDSRGRTASETFTVTLMDYAPPTLTGIEIFRCDNQGDADEDGGYYTAKATLTYSSLNSQNVCPIIVYHKAAGGSYSSDGYLTSGQFPVSPPYVSSLNPDYTYTIKISATDSLGNSVEYYVTLPTRKWAMKFRSDGNGVAFGKAAETDGLFEITAGWDVKICGNKIKPVLAASAAFAIPASGSSVSYDMDGLTVDYELARWNFSVSAENAPPVDLTWTTYAGYFTITNDGGTTSETIRPVFVYPAAVTLTAH